MNRLQLQQQQQLLEAILDKTSHVRNGLAAKDMDIVVCALNEREDLISRYSKSNFGALNAECAKIAYKISDMNAENSKNLKALMDECQESLMEARRKIQELKTGKKATHQYHGAASANRGAVFDFKR
jgi:hypothetical protein